MPAPLGLRARADRLAAQPGQLAVDVRQLGQSPKVRAPGSIRLGSDFGFAEVVQDEGHLGALLNERDGLPELVGPHTEVENQTAGCQLAHSGHESRGDDAARGLVLQELPDPLDLPDGAVARDVRRRPRAVELGRRDHSGHPH